ncbi:exodeoxyribonuclease III Xth [Desulfovibrio sp. X2]|uniref:exodeoxyribonuclease III n=1 Tax=Desulfovibrio sp. X2 TaxID=941449 RepID=UPI000358E989|nr:exodeoxyribonuclease III [Desulfovibrio sp. X2]EPR41416.1 exodeoxyribonuclease III Xth [Desulfovibrio sp. X2]
MILYSWNVNGFRAAAKKGFWDWFSERRADVVCLQETKASPEQLAPTDLDPEGYVGFWNSATMKKGYSGTACLCRVPPLNHRLDMPWDEWRGEGRLVHVEYPAFHLLNCYFPNSGQGPVRLAYKLGFYQAFLDYCEELRTKKPVVFCGDVNTAHRPIDLHDPVGNAKSSGFLPEEREWVDRFVAAGYVDTFRLFTEDGGHYTWWDYRTRARPKNIGWRIDYFFVSEELRDKVARAWIEPEVMGSDHCPVGLELSV